MPPQMPVDWTTAFAEMTERWNAMQPSPAAPDLEEWAARMTAMRTKTIELKRLGQWSRGPVDLLTICRLHRWELAHSAALSWLCDPDAGHGLGTRFLTRMLAHTGDIPDLDQDITVTTEATRDLSRADIVVAAATWTLVIEVKVDAEEGNQQCERLYQDWVEDGDVRFLFLTKTGRPPLTTVTDEASSAWHAASWPAVLADLRAVEDSVPPAAAGAGAITEYRRTLEFLYGRRR
jgi:hypothetical protein